MSFATALMEHDFLRVVALAALIAAISGGVVGTIVVTRRLTFLAGGIAHASLGGMGVFQWAGHDPIAGATVAAVIAALLIGVVAHRGSEREDMLIGAIWAVGMAIGLIAIAHTPGYQADLMTYLLGNLLMVTFEEALLMATIMGVVMILVALFWQPIVATLFDEEFATTRGLPTLAIELAVLVSIALVVVVLLRAVGLVLVMALLTLPTATAGVFVRTLGRLMLASATVALLAMWAGLEIAMQTDSPAGASIVLSAAACYILALSYRRLRPGQSGSQDQPDQKRAPP
ncbi:MAG: metal ABC transporter permease [Wenzhouxiangella sp.]|jgi:zinc transport system permease protein|nr:metal ABC transporter permease [Wenzhouxiangella sp.]